MTQPTRRDALKALAAATGAVTIASLPTRWSKPAVRVGAMPAHAQTSCFDLVIEFTEAGDFAYEDLPAADEGNSNPMNTAGVWRWYCGSIPGSLCFTLRNDTPDGGNRPVRLTSRNGTVIDDQIFESSSEAYSFDSVTGTVVSGCAV